MPRLITIVSAALLFCTGLCRTAFAERPLASAAEALLKADYFSVFPVGVAATTSGNEANFRDFLKRGATAKDALKLIADGTPAAKVYGFLALQKMSPPQFAELAPRQFLERAAVPVQSGCVPFSETLGSLVKQIAEGKISLRPERK